MELPSYCASVVINHDPFHPARHREVKTLTGPAPIKYLTPKTRRPFIVLRNGEAVLRKDWGQIVGNLDTINIVMLPQGGGDDDGGSNVGQIIMMIIVAIVAYYTGVYVGGEEYLALGNAAGYAAQAAVAAVGNPLIITF